MEVAHTAQDDALGVVMPSVEAAIVLQHQQTSKAA